MHQLLNVFNMQAKRSGGLLRLYYGTSGKEGPRAMKIIRELGYGVISIPTVGYQRPQIELYNFDPIVGIENIKKVLTKADPETRLYKNGWTHERRSKLFNELFRLYILRPKKNQRTGEA